MHVCVYECELGKGLKTVEDVRGQHDCQVSALGIKRPRRIRENNMEGKRDEELQFRPDELKVPVTHTGRVVGKEVRNMGLKFKMKVQDEDIILVISE